MTAADLRDRLRGVLTRANDALGDAAVRASASSTATGAEVMRRAAAHLYQCGYSVAAALVEDRIGTRGSPKDVLFESNALTVAADALRDTDDVDEALEHLAAERKRMVENDYLLVDARRRARVASRARTATLKALELLAQHKGCRP